MKTMKESMKEPWLSPLVPSPFEVGPVDGRWGGSRSVCVQTKLGKGSVMDVENALETAGSTLPSRSRRFLRRLGPVAVAAGLLALSLPRVALAQQSEHPLSLGVGLGGGSTSIRPHGVGSLDSGFVAAMVHLGWQLVPALRIGMEVHGGTFALHDDWLSVNHISLAAVSLFPAPAFGFYLKAGIGLGYLNTTAASTTTGFDLLAAVGYEHWFMEHFGAGLEGWVARTSYGDGVEADGGGVVMVLFRL